MPQAEQEAARGVARSALRPPPGFEVSRYRVDLSSGRVDREQLSGDDLDDVLGGVARAFKLLWREAVEDPYHPSAPLVMNLGLLSGTRVTTGLRTYFTGFSPLKTSLAGAPGLMWSAGSGSFGTRLRGLGVDEVVFTGQAEHPALLHISSAGDGGPARFELLPATDLLGKKVNDRIQELHHLWPDAHFAVIGSAGEHPVEVRYAAIALSTDNQLKSGDAKARSCGRGGFGGVLGAKNLIAVVADGPNPAGGARGLKVVNREIGYGSGSLPYRDDGGGGTWRLLKVQHDAGCLPEFNFSPPGDDRAVALMRPSVEAGPYLVRAEGCYLCGIRCHKNVYASTPSGEEGPFLAKVDYEPVTMLSVNLGIYDPGAALTLIQLADELGLDSISLGVTLGYVMEWNRRHPDAPLVGGLAYGDTEGVARAIEATGEGRLPEVGQGTLRLASALGDTGYAMHSKGVEYPAYLPHVNPGYPWALAGGHMSMRTYLLLLLERETGLDYWVDAITNRGPQIMLDDITGLCKFAMIDAETEAEAIRLAAGLEITADDLRAVVERTYLRGYASERRQGFADDDYRLPAEAHLPAEASRLPYFNTPDFFDRLHARVTEVFEERARAAGYL